MDELAILRRSWMLTHLWKQRTCLLRLLTHFAELDLGGIEIDACDGPLRDHFLESRWVGMSHAMVELKRGHCRRSSLACTQRSKRFYAEEGKDTVSFRDWHESVANWSSEVADLAFEVDMEANMCEVADGDEGDRHIVRIENIM